VQVYHCDRCGRRLTESELAEGFYGLRVGDRCFCHACWETIEARADERRELAQAGLPVEAVHPDEEGAPLPVEPAEAAPLLPMEEPPLAAAPPRAPGASASRRTVLLALIIAAAALAVADLCGEIVFGIASVRGQEALSERLAGGAAFRAFYVLRELRYVVLATLGALFVLAAPSPARADGHRPPVF
jgi:hypothetical protein